MDAWLAAHRLTLSLALVVVAFLGVGVYLGGREGDGPLLISVPTPVAAVGGPKAYVSGEVANPGVYTFEPGDRVEQLVALAGGFTAVADVEAINLALRLRDEQQVHVPRIASTPAQGSAASKSSPTSALVDLNTASTPELEALPGIGPAIAQRIVDHRTKVGPFLAPEDLLTLKLVNSSTFEKIRERITVR